MDKKKRVYLPSSLTNAYMLVKDEGMSLRRAALRCNVPESTLRDRTFRIVSVDTLSAGAPPLFEIDEKMTLGTHFQKMAHFGYGYTRQECVDNATDYAIQLGKRSKDKPLTMKWFRGFIKRWPELRVIVPRNLEYARAKMASADVVKTYFDSLNETLEKHDLLEKPHLILNVDEKGVTVEHKPSFIVASARQTPAVTSGKGKTITMLGCGSAAGQSIPPFFVFPGQRMRQDLLSGATPGADGTVSETGWLNGIIFREYLETHFLKYVPGRSKEKILLMMDGHKSHVSVGLYEWAFDYNIVIFILHPYCSHILQPMDVGCFGPFQRLYNDQCHKLMRQISAVITRYDICKIACQVYAKALSAENLQSAFRRTGIYPMTNEAVSSEKTLPAEVFRCELPKDSQTAEADTDIVAYDMFNKRENKLKQIISETVSKQRKTISKIVAGKEITSIIIDKMNQHNENPKLCTAKTVLVKGKGKKAEGKVKTSVPIISSPKPGPSHMNLISESAESDYEESELFCQCGKFSPDELYRSTSLIFIKWGQCDHLVGSRTCNHWCHLGFRTPVRVLRRGTISFVHDVTRRNRQTSEKIY